MLESTLSAQLRLRGSLVIGSTTTSSMGTVMLEGANLVDSSLVVDALVGNGGLSATHLPMNGAEYASGLSLGPGSFFGRRAGRHAAGAGAGRGAT